MKYIPEKLRRLVFERARGRCEYCLLHADDALFSHEIDHIYAEKHGGETAEDNLCLCCSNRNRQKGSDIASRDPESGHIVPLFNPRLDLWDEHFVLNGPMIEGLTPQGRVTVRLLGINAGRRVTEREGLIALSRYP